MAIPKRKRIVFISYAHADERERPADDEVKCLSFVTGYLRAAVKHDAIEILVDTLLRAGEKWDFEIERKLRQCGIFIPGPPCGRLPAPLQGVGRNPGEQRNGDGRGDEQVDDGCYRQTEGQAEDDADGLEAEYEEEGECSGLAHGSAGNLPLTMP